MQEWCSCRNGERTEQISGLCVYAKIVLVCLQVGFGSGFKCNSAVWRALRTINSQHESWKHLPATRPDQQDSQLRVENNTAEKTAAAAKPDNVPVRAPQSNGFKTADSQETQALAKTLAPGEHIGSDGADSTGAAGKGNGMVPNGQPNIFDGKVPKAGQLKDNGSGSGEIKAHNEPVNGIHSMAVL